MAARLIEYQKTLVLSESMCWARSRFHSVVVAYVDVGEFGNQSHDRATLWSGGREVLSRGTIRAVLAYFRAKAGLDLGDRPIEVQLELYRGEDAAEKWATASSQAGKSSCCRRTMSPLVFAILI